MSVSVPSLLAELFVDSLGLLHPARGPAPAMVPAMKVRRLMIFPTNLPVLKLAIFR